MIRLPLLPQLEGCQLRTTLANGSRLEGEGFASRPDALCLDVDDRLFVIPWASVLTVEVLEEPPGPSRRRK